MTVEQYVNQIGKGRNTNVSMKLLVELPEIPYNLRKLQMNRGNGFYWKPDGFYEFGTGRSYESLPLKNEDK